MATATVERPESAAKPSRRRESLLICVLLVAITLAVYWQVTGFDFTYFDDNYYVTQNPHATGGLNLQEVIWAFTSHRCNNWHPLTWISHMTDCQLSELDPGAHHFTSLLLHIANVLLLFVVFDRLTGRRWRSALVAALFAAHPLHVESVAWVAERKDVLSTFFWLLTMLAYWRYARSRRAGNYALVLLAFILGLLSKPMLVTLPFVLLLLDFWPLGKGRESCAVGAGKDVPFIRRALASLAPNSQLLAPMFALALASCIVTFTIQKTTGAVATLDAYPVGVRVANALVGCVGYLAKAVWPARLACFYPHPGAGIPVWQTVGSVLLLTGITITTIRARRRAPYLTVGWLWYLITLVPVIGLVQVGKQATADRYTYVPLIGVFVAIVWGLGDLLRARSRPAIALEATAALGVVLALSVVAHRQASYWRNDVSIWTRALAVTQNNAIAHYNLGTTLAVQGDDDGAIRHFRESARIDPRKFDALANLGAMLATKGIVGEAIEYLEASIRVKPNNPDPHLNLGLLLMQQGKFEEAIPHLRVALRFYPQNANCREALAAAMEQRQGDAK